MLASLRVLCRRQQATKTVKQQPTEQRGRRERQERKRWNGTGELQVQERWKSERKRSSKLAKRGCKRETEGRDRKGNVSGAFYARDS